MRRGKQEGSSQPKLTPFDTNAILMERARVAALPSTIADRSPARARLRRSVADECYRMKQVDDEREIRPGHGGGRPEGGLARGKEAYVVIGPPAAGKSTLARQLSARTRSLIIDADTAKAKLPEFDGGRGAAAVHLESVEIVEKLVLPKAVGRGENVVAPRVGKNTAELRAFRDALKGFGYRVHLILNHLGRDETTRRSIARWRSTGRFVDPDYVYNSVGERPRETYNLLRDEGGFDSYAHYVNDTPQGRPPRVIERDPASPDLGYGEPRPARQ